MSLRLVPISIRDATAYVARWHRHLDPSPGALWAHAAYRDRTLEPAGVCLVGRPVASASQDGLTVEVLRMAVPTHASDADRRNVCSFLYARARRAAQAMGYRRCVTTTRVDESGASLRALGLQPDRKLRGREWDAPSRPRARRGRHALVDKLGWTLFDDRPGIESVPPDRPKGATKVQKNAENDDGTPEGAVAKSNNNKDLQ